MGGGEGTSDLEPFFQTTVIAAVGRNTVQSFEVHRWVHWWVRALVDALVGAQMGTQVGAVGTLGNTGGCIQRLILICRSTKSPPPLIFFFISFASGFLQSGANYEKIRNSLTPPDHLIRFILVVRNKECLL